MVISNVATIFLIVAIVVNFRLILWWKVTKHYATENDDLLSTGLWRSVALYIFTSLFQSYPFFHGAMYEESFNDASIGQSFRWNDLLVVIMIFFRSHYFIRALLSISFYTDPRPQRVCNLYGTDADYSFAVKSMMRSDPLKIQVGAMICSVIIFTYATRIIESQI